MINENSKLFFIVNKYSGTGFNPELEGLVRNNCGDHRMECDLAYTQGRGHATELATRAIADGFEYIVAVGGDGTVNEVAQAVLHTPATMGILPKGSGNGLARHLGIPIRFDSAIQEFFDNKVVAIDTFRLNGSLSLNVSGIGFDGFVAEKFGADHRRGFQGYARLVLNEFPRFREFEATIVTEQGSQKHNALVIAVANSSQYGNNVRIAPGASVHDQLVDISILRKFPSYRLDVIFSFFTGTITRSRRCKTLRAHSATITLDREMPYHIDGEPTGKASKFNVEILPSSVRMLAPCTGKF